MEGKGVSYMKKSLSSFVFILVMLRFIPSLKAQDAASYHWQDHWIPVWEEMRGSFLEPNRFATAFDFKPQWYRIEAGYGGELARISTVAVGAEGLIWSGLAAYKDFRFPVQTADYFFGVYSIFPLPIWGENLEVWRMRFRLSHISSHLVDGAASITPGASSEYSREFISLESLFDETEKNNFRFSLGVKFVFHQVMNIEQKFQFPGVLDIILYNKSDNQLFATISTAAGPTLAAYSAGLTFRRTTESKTFGDLYAEYHAGRSRYGVYSAEQQDGFEIGIRIGAKKVLEK
jgi:hypothetical protein